MSHCRQHKCRQALRIYTQYGVARILDEPSFYVMGLLFKFVVGEGLVEENPLGLHLIIDATSATTLAAGWRIAMRAVVHYDTALGQSGMMDNDFTEVLHAEKLQMFVTGFNTTVNHLTLYLTFTFDDVHPYRHWFMNKAISQTKRFDSKLMIRGHEETPIYVNKELLAMNSPFFESFFFPKKILRSRNKERVLREVTIDEMLEYLYCVHAPTRPFKFERMRVILKMATRFDNFTLLAEAENFLLSTDLIESHKKNQVLVWADEFGRRDLFRYILDLMALHELNQFAATIPSVFRNEEFGKLFEMRRGAQSIPLYALPQSSHTPMYH